MDSLAIVDAVTSVTKKWCKQRKAEERDSRAYARRSYYYSDRVYFTDIAEETIPQGYAHASSNGKYMVSKRQLYYACRDAFQEATGREITQQNFDRIALRFMNQNPDICASWRITADPRGTIQIPNGQYEINIPVGTIAIDDYLGSRHVDEDPYAMESQGLPIEFGSIAEQERFQGILYIEKEGFAPILKEAQIAERYDLAVMSCKGQSNGAARKLVDELCAVREGIPLFIVHDFDPAGFSIAETLVTESLNAQYQDRVVYHFKNKIKYHDLGLRLKDCEQYKLQSESFSNSKTVYIPSVCTKEERSFFRSGQRVELNSFTTEQFIEWLTAKLDFHLPKRLVPNDSVLDVAYRRALCVSEINAAIKTICERRSENDDEIEVPPDLRQMIESHMKTHKVAWDVAVYQIADRNEID